ncbi:xylulokinase [Arthrobacter tecti]
MTLVAGVDSSTQSCKLVIKDSDSGAVVSEGRASHPFGTEVHPDAWWLALQNATRSAGGLDGVEALAVCGQQHGMVALDSDGRVIRPALLWNDTRSAQAARDLTEELGAEAYAQRTGVVPVASFTAAKLRWLREFEPENAQRVAAVALPHDWLSWRLRGFGPSPESEHGPVLDELTTDRSDASGTAYWNPDTDGYDLELFERALGHPAVLPRILRPNEAAGNTPEGILIAAGAGDNAGAALGLNTQSGDVVVSIGTSGTVFSVMDNRITDPTGAVAGFADASGGFLPITVTLNAARILSSISGILGVNNDEMAGLALAAEPGAGGVVLIPYFEGERTPNHPDATASFYGLSLASSSRQNIARAAIEGMLCGLAAGLDEVRRVGVREERVLLIGGAAQNPAVQAIAAQVFDSPVTMPTPSEYVANGAALQAAWALTGKKPEWPVSTVTELPANTQQVIREQYGRYASVTALR